MQLEALFQQPHALPVAPMIVNELVRSFDNPAIATEDIARQLGADPVLSAKLLRLANSAYYHVSRSVGTVEDFQQVEPRDAWKNSGRYTAINGQVQPILSLFERQVYRWRLVDTGFQSSVVLRIKRASDAARLEAYIKRPNGGEDVEAICDGEDVTQFEVASDGLTHGRIIGKTASYLQPGYRSDIVFALPKAGAVIFAPSPAITACAWSIGIQHFPHA